EGIYIVLSVPIINLGSLAKFGLGAVVLGCLATSSVAPVAADLSAPTGPRLMLAENFPDPDVMKAGDAYYAYSTTSPKEGNVPVAMSQSLDGGWQRQVDALPTLGSWADTTATWGPPRHSSVNRGGAYRCALCALLHCAPGPHLRAQ
ncbi:MAG: hypothetical protein ACREP9_04960, partial [Candidatus Dormibacteraceae bacterium]